MPQFTLTVQGQTPFAGELSLMDGLYGIVKSTFDIHKMSRPTFNEWEEKHTINPNATGLPDAWRFSEKNPSEHPEYIPLTYDRQHWLLKINLEIVKGREYTKAEYFQWYNARSAEVGVMVGYITGACTADRSHTNYYGLDNMRNDLTGERLDRGYAKWSKILTGRACLKLVPETGTTDQPMVRNVPGVGTCVAFQCISASEDYWKYSPLREWWLFDEPLSTGRVIGRSNAGPYIVRDDLHIPYPQFWEKLVFPLWLPNANVGWLPISQVVPSPPQAKKTWYR